MTYVRAILIIAAFTILVLNGNVASAADGTGINYAEVNDRLERGELTAEEVAGLIELAERIKARAKEQLTLVQRVERALVKPWVVFGFLAQFAFMMRFVVQLVASERKKRSYVPVAFWYLSLLGGGMLFVYALRVRDPVFVFGQGLGCLIYIRNLILIYRRKGKLGEAIEARRERAAARRAAKSVGAAEPDPSESGPPQA